MLGNSVDVVDESVSQDQSLDVSIEHSCVENTVLTPLKRSLALSDINSSDIKRLHVDDTHHINTAQASNLQTTNHLSLPNSTAQTTCFVSEKDSSDDLHNFDSMDEVLATVDIDSIVAPLMSPDVKIQQDGPANLSMLLKTFYQRLFPFKEMYRWLSYGGVHNYHFTNREFSFTLLSETYLRYQSYKGFEDLKADIVRLCPAKIDIGAVYNIKPCEGKTVASSVFIPVERELVFDIDMTDYDEIRTCCSGANVCKKCWHFMTISIKIIHRALKEDFGFKHILWVFSGRRGVHCWVSDERARKLTVESRRAIVSYLEIIHGGDNMAQKVNLKATLLHPSLALSYDVCLKYFEPVLLDKMQILATPERWNKVLRIISDESICKSLNGIWSSNPDSSCREKWNQLKRAISDDQKPALKVLPRNIILQYTYPRLDSNVSIGLNHLLKSPFCVHPKTGFICVPIDPARCEEFDPHHVPTIDSLIKELDELPPFSQSIGSGGSGDYERTSLGPYVKYFKEQFLDSMSESIRESLRQKKADMDKSLQF
ncbi:p48 polypeptide of DNA primase [Batrachochytrium dendrobatidis]|nr:p48 polypeptide of DNA primase [Batrachochytrium dendrobatidis]